MNVKVKGKGNKMAEAKDTSKLICTESAWNFDIINAYYNACEDVAVNQFGLDVYPNQLEIISAEQMMDAYSSSGLPVMYKHWSYGKSFIQTNDQYQNGQMGLAYEIVINSSPCISYLMESNTSMMQCLVTAHAAFGHNYFFKNNYLFKEWTDAESILDYLVFAQKYIAECEEKYGETEVESFIDSCHALQNYGVDKYKRPSPLSAEEEDKLQQERTEYVQSQANELWRSVVPLSDNPEEVSQERFPLEPQENMLYFFEKNAPLLKPWQREVIRIVRKMAQYFYPQRQTKVANEGCATFFHYEIIHELYKKGLVDDGFMLEFYESHTGVIAQQAYNSPYYGGINPYTLGFSILQDVKRMCLEPTEEDYKWFPDLAGSQDWLSAVKFAVCNFKDDSFIHQYLSPKVIRDMKLFSFVNDHEDSEYEISAIHEDQGYRHVRGVLAQDHNMEEHIPDIQVYNVNKTTNRALYLRHYMYKGRPLDREATLETLKHVLRLWQFDVIIESVDDEGRIRAKYRIDEEGPLMDIFEKDKK